MRKTVQTKEQKHLASVRAMDWARKNPERVREIKERHLEKNKDKVRELARARSLARYYRMKNNPGQHKRKIIEIGMRNRFSRFARRGKSISIKEVISYSFEELAAHIERQLEDGMSWNNRSKWHIDHIRPLSSFADPCDPAAWCLSNLRPVWASENLKKNSKALFLL